ncbi:hypothetical protein LCGC14_1429170 [marine sediment metagenome]|uniref:Uncharacterized protein n=1 Tax=marine sediment metagenome TaxID=412755 RepID=A0A0F9KA88_9ZZZZ
MNESITFAQKVYFVLCEPVEINALPVHYWSDSTYTAQYKLIHKVLLTYLEFVGTVLYFLGNGSGPRWAWYNFYGFY